MKKNKLILLTVSSLITTFSIGSTKNTFKFNGEQQLYTNATTAGCRIAQCFRVSSGSGNGCVPGVQYYTRDLGVNCAGPYNGIRTSTP